jgi:hypothetical protein
MIKNERLIGFKQALAEEPYIKQNPAIGGICCSQLVLVTQTLPK